MKLVKKIFPFALLIVLFLFVSCSDEPETETADYYVRYEANVNSKTSKVEYTVNTDTGSKTFVGGKNFSQTFGPVKKGFRASIDAYSAELTPLSVDAYIYICKGAEPWGLKAHGILCGINWLIYTID